MSVRHSLLALLERGPMHGYGLKSEFEVATGQMWPLNDGQVYTTLTRLERDGLVEADEEADGQRAFRLTGAGRDELRSWFSEAVRRDLVPRQELAIKLIFAVRSPSADVHQVIQRQRAATVRSLQELTRLKGKGGGDDLAWTLTLDGLLFQGEAEVRWLDLCEARLAGAGSAATAATFASNGATEGAAEGADAADHADGADGADTTAGPGRSPGVRPARPAAAREGGRR
jgi:DNA-binding PadR family transcriptional regulator